MFRRKESHKHQPRACAFRESLHDDIAAMRGHYLSAQREPDTAAFALTIAYQAARAALTRPVSALRYE